MSAETRVSLGTLSGSSGPKPRMIISASYKTDIPAFYGHWFLNRLDAGYCKVVNPYNQRVLRVELTRETVDGFVFWTKNLGPFIDKLKIVNHRGYPFFVQYTINGYPRILEFSVATASRSVEHMKLLSGDYGPKATVWRYDTILFTSSTTVDFHRRNFEALAKMLEGTTNEVVISFAQIYKKTLRNLNLAAEKLGFTWNNPDDEVKLSLTADLLQIAKAYRMQLKICSQRKFLLSGVEEARCIDARRLSEIAGHPINVQLKGNRTDCGCYETRDIGEYDTCPHGCVYCYAVLNHELAQRRYKEHDPSTEFLLSPKNYAPADESQEIEDDDVQMRLF